MTRTVLPFFIALLAALASCQGDAPGEKPFYLRALDEIFAEEDVQALARAAGRGDLQTVDDLVQKGTSVNSRGAGGLTPLFWALRSQSKQGFKHLLENGANPNLRWESGSSIIHLAAGLQDSDYLRMVLEHGGNPNLVDPRMAETPLFDAVSPEGKGNLELLVKAGADLEHQNKFGQTPILTAATLRQYDVVYRLMELGADVKHANNWHKDIRYYVKRDATMDPDHELSRWRRKVIVALRDKGLDITE